MKLVPAFLYYTLVFKTMLFLVKVWDWNSIRTNQNYSEPFGTNQKNFLKLVWYKSLINYQTESFRFNLRLQFEWIRIKFLIRINPRSKWSGLKICFKSIRAWIDSDQNLSPDLFGLKCQIDSERIRTIPSHSEQMRKHFWNSFDTNRLKINPIHSSSIWDFNSNESGSRF